MLDGLIHSYLDALGRAWQPRDEFVGANWDSLLGKGTLVSPQTGTGEADENRSGSRRHCTGNRDECLCQLAG